METDLRPQREPDSREREDVLGGVMLFLRSLHERSYPGNPQAHQMAEGRMHELNPIHQKNLSMLLRQIRRRLQRRLENDVAEPPRWTPELVASVHQAIARKKIEAALAARWHDHVLSTPGHPIRYQRYGKFLLKAELEKIVMSGRVEDLRNIAWICFDVNGLKSVNDCTNRMNGCKYLRTIAKLFLNRQGPTRRWLEEGLKARITALTGGGDEFGLLLRGRSPFAPEALQKIVEMYQAEIASSPELIGFVDFENTEVLMKYGALDQEEKKNLSLLSAQKRAKVLKGIRDSLPEKFTPSIAGGAASLDEGILRALDLEGEGRLRIVEDETFDDACGKIAAGLINKADARQSSNKKKMKAELDQTNPKLGDFFRRNKENRELAQAHRDAQKQIAELMAQLREGGIEIDK